MERAADSSIFVVPQARLVRAWGTASRRARRAAGAAARSTRRTGTVVRSARRTGAVGVQVVQRSAVAAMADARARYERLDGEQRRWLAAAALTVTVLGAGVAVPTGTVTPAAAGEQAPGQGGAAGGTAAVPPQLTPGPFTPAAPPTSAPVPIGKGMWLNRFERSAGGDPHRLVAEAQAHGLTHVYVRLGSSTRGFYAQGDLERLLPVAHAAGLKVVGWDFPTLRDVGADAARAAAQIRYTTLTGHRIDAFSADIETQAEGTNLSAGGALLYGRLVREAAGPGYPLIATVPRPSPKRWFPFAEAVASFDAVAPMVYWGSRDPVRDVTGAIAALAPYGKPVIPVGQAYDSAIDGWKGGSPTKEAVAAFTQAAYDAGAVGVSFWVWQTAEPQHWAAIKEAEQFVLRPDAVAKGDVVAVRYLQRVLAALGQPTVVDGVFGYPTKTSLEGLQRRLGLEPTGTLDDATVAALTRSLQTDRR